MNEMVEDKKIKHFSWKIIYDTCNMLQRWMNEDDESIMEAEIADMNVKMID